MAPRIQIIGIGDDGADGLTAYARSLIDDAEVLAGPAELLERVPFGPSERVAIGNDLDSIRDAVASLAGRRAVMLAEGDPLFYGIARFLSDSVGKHCFDVVPHVSSMQLAFARIKESWDDAYLTNLATQPLDRVVETIRTAEHVGLFTTEAITPSVVAESLLDRRIDYFNAYVCENLGSPDERVTQGDLETIRKMQFAPLNVMILVRHRGAADRPREWEGRRLFGNPDEYFLQSRPKRGLLTPTEVRCLALAEMDLAPRSIVWDVGAGSGSLAIEASGLAHQGQVYAIEMDAEDYGLMLENAKIFQCPSLVPVHGSAPAAWEDLPDPDAIFVGGLGRAVTDLSVAACGRLKRGGRIVINVASIDSLASVRNAVRNEGIEVDVRMINIARGVDSLGALRLESMNPSFLIAGRKR
ncbi:precorrin-6y C5,15-methyltransferase (decarboxylating) subunit CbiE [Candidatus Laterigemmans baculatus]|uniref:precorrin-6y C5,15-methyltransferase (decarboxylating) subunit CbiE n=1 Tax=Candidatus Laterigemmans baculatus TaxID=2770505 RepID=UPI0013DA0C05|nr:precorrin-6y C5,15-methyltransferase (decarboxylating) subunit CbiE [Candidatus Laterigemmans baculatus]